MSRYYVRPAFHDAGIIQARVSCIMTEAAAVGYFRRIVHTMPDWSPARALYYILGFEPIPAYAHDIYIARA